MARVVLIKLIATTTGIIITVITLTMPMINACRDYHYAIFI